MAKGVRYPDDVRKAVLAAYASGEAMKAIANRHGMHTNTVRTIAREGQLRRREYTRRAAP